MFQHKGPTSIVMIILTKQRQVSQGSFKMAFTSETRTSASPGTIIPSARNFEVVARYQILSEMASKCESGFMDQWPS
jgi:hypothetical protein